MIQVIRPIMAHQWFSILNFTLFLVPFPRSFHSLHLWFLPGITTTPQYICHFIVYCTRMSISLIFPSTWSPDISNIWGSSAMKTNKFWSCSSTKVSTFSHWIKCTWPIKRFTFIRITTLSFRFVFKYFLRREWFIFSSVCIMVAVCRSSNVTIHCIMISRWVSCILCSFPCFIWIHNWINRHILFITFKHFDDVLFCHIVAITSKIRIRMRIFGGGLDTLSASLNTPLSNDLIRYS